MSTFRIPGFKSLGITSDSKGDIVILRIGINPEKYLSFSNEVKEILWIPEREKEEVRRFANCNDYQKSLYESYSKAIYALQIVKSDEAKQVLEQVIENLKNALNLSL